jgi:pyrroline-5-carboxylate reductase
MKEEKIMGEHKTIALLGPGAMGEAIIIGLLDKGITVPEKIRASTPEVDRIAEITNRYNVLGFYDNLEAVAGADLVILAVKPQKLYKVLEGLKNRIPKDAVVLSIIAGATLDTLSNGLNHDSVVRAMPNTPAQIGQGITVWTATHAVNEEQLKLAGQVLTAMGQEVHVEEETYLDMATALSGSGPAYVFLFMEAMIDAGVHMGFPRRTAEQLVTQTILGSVMYAQKNGMHPAQLRNQVTSPGGTSAEALYYLEKAGIRTAFSRAIWAAYERSIELGKGLNSKPPEMS